MQFAGQTGIILFPFYNANVRVWINTSKIDEYIHEQSARASCVCMCYIICIHRVSDNRCNTAHGELK